MIRWLKNGVSISSRGRDETKILSSSSFLKEEGGGAASWLWAEIQRVGIGRVVLFRMWQFLGEIWCREMVEEGCKTLKSLNCERGAFLGIDRVHST